MKINLLFEVKIPVIFRDILNRGNCRLFSLDSSPNFVILTTDGYSSMHSPKHILISN